VDYKTIDINVDLGEGIGNEEELMPYISSCNIACGGHAGDIDTMKSVIKLAKQYHVKIGAHPSFPDKKNFGRVKMNLSDTDLFNTIKTQVEDLILIINEEEAILHHIKLHGALYNLAAIDNNIAHTVLKALKSIALPVKLYVPYKSVIAQLAIENNIEIVYEAFADRMYNDDLTLVSRTHKQALIYDEDKLFNHIYNMVTKQKVKTISGVEVDIIADTFCIHGDNPKAIILIKKLKERLISKGVKIV